MSSHDLDRPVWDSLRTGHQRFAIGNAQALRFDVGVSPFAGIPDTSAASLEALCELIPSNGQIMLLQTDPVVCPRDCEIVQRAKGVQMLFTGNLQKLTAQHTITLLGEDDAKAMHALATMTKPGPFLQRTHELGRFLGIYDNGRLVAMAGERLKHNAYTEVSAVCTHPDYRRSGTARALSLAVTSAILQRGERPYLQAFAENTAAIKLYQSLGFSIRAELDVAVIGRKP